MRVSGATPGGAPKLSALDRHNGAWRPCVVTGWRGDGALGGIELPPPWALEPEPAKYAGTYRTEFIAAGLRPANREKSCSKNAGKPS